MLRIESEDPYRHLVGLDHRLKGEDRLFEKVESHLRASPDISYYEAFAKVKDAVRFTFEYEKSRYAEGVITDCARLEEAGFKHVDLRNTWAKRGVQRDQQPVAGTRKRPTLRGPVPHSEQFRGQATDPSAYEKIRDPATPKSERDELMDCQREVCARIPIPPGAPGIPNYP